MINIYKLSCETGKVYYGSTNNINKRLSNHKSNLTCMSKDFINPNIEVLETCKEEERKEREGYYIRNFDCVNKCIPGRTQKEYRETNKEKYKKLKKEWDEKNKEHCKKYQKDYNKTNSMNYYKNNQSKLKEKFDCPCGGKYTYAGKYQHNKTKKHLEFMETIQP
jgi:hypothetical protein